VVPTPPGGQQLVGAPGAARAGALASY
jgi:hypothetical protein